MFDIGRCQHEIIMSACSEREEEVWKSHLFSRITIETGDYNEGRKDLHDLLAVQHIEMRGTAYGLFSKFSKAGSIQRAATLGPKSSIEQVIIKNTEAQKYSNNSASTSILRSHSHMSPTSTKALVPRRTERSKLEGTISDVWTKNLLPYPGMGGRRGENPIRASANSVMRKLSMASIASNFSKRSLSYSTLSFQRTDEGYASSTGKSTRTVRPHKAPDKRKRHVVVDFHTTPKAFLPEDFELPNSKILNNPNRRSRKLALLLSMGSDLPQSEPLTPDPKVSMPDMERETAIVPASDPARSLDVLAIDGVANEIQVVPCVRSTSLETISSDAEKVVMFDERPTASSGETPTQKSNKARKGIFRLFG
jgi:hypothetical protein